MVFGIRRQEHSPLVEDRQAVLLDRTPSRQALDRLRQPGFEDPAVPRVQDALGAGKGREHQHIEEVVPALGAGR